MTDQQLALIVYLRCCGPANRSAVIDALWDGRRISNQRVANLMAQIRSKIGREHLPDPTDGRYRTSGITTDVELFETAIRTISGQVGRGAVEASPLVSSIASACRLIRGVPLSTGTGRHWSWLDHRPGLLSFTESTISSGVQTLADAALRCGQPMAAGAALEAGLLACPWDEFLVLRLTQIYLDQRRLALARRLVDGWEQRIRRLDCGEPSCQPRRLLSEAGQAASIGSAVTTRFPR